jgi:hypothetical protein
MLTSHSNSNEYGCHMDIVEHCSSGLARITLISSSTPRHHSLGIRDSLGRVTGKSMEEGDAS